MKTYENKPTTCQIGPVRAFYPTVFKPRKNTIKDGEPLQYSITMLIPKEPHPHLPNPQAEYDAVKDIIKKAAVQGFGEKPPKGLKFPIKDGDYVAEGEDGPSHPGYWVLRAATNAAYPDGTEKKLLVVDGRGQPISGGFAGGDWCVVKVSFKPFDKAVNKGVTCYLEGVQWLFKDEPLGESSETTPDEFDTYDVPTAAGVATADEYDPFAED